MAKDFNPTYVSNKLFLDQTGLQALILKIANLKKSIEADYNGKIDELGLDIADLKALLDTILAWETDAETGNVVAKGILKDVIDAAAALRDELGDSEGAVDGKTVYVRLKALEDALANIDVENLNKLIADAFVDLNDPVYNKEDQTVNIEFKNLAGDVVKTAVIDMTPFIVHGMLDDVKLAVVANDADANATLADGTQIPVTVEGGLKAGKYLVFDFKVKHDDANNNHGEENKTVWVNVNDLFTDYVFETTDDNDYIKATFVEDPSNSFNAAQKWTLTVVPGEAQVKVNDLVEGNYPKPGQSAEGDKYLGIEGLNDVLETTNKNLDDLTNTVDALDKVVNGTEAEEYEDGLVKRVETLEAWQPNVDKNLEELNNWTENNIIPTAWISAIWDYIINEDRGDAPKPEDYLD